MHKLKEKCKTLSKRLSAIKKTIHKLDKPLYRIFVIIMIALISSTHITLPVYAEMVQVSEETDFNDTQHAYSVEKRCRSHPARSICYFNWLVL